MNLKLRLGIQSKIKRGNVTFVYLSELESELTTERWRNTLESEIYHEILIQCVAEWDSSSSNKIVQRFVLFVCGIFVTLALDFNYAILTPGDLRQQYGISGGVSQKSVFAFHT